SVLTSSSEKLTQDVEAPSSGILLSQDKKAGEEAQVGEVIGTIGEEGEEPSTSTGEAEMDKEESTEKREESDSEQEEKVSSGKSETKQPTTPSSSERVFITPLARKMAKDKNLEIEMIKGTGGNGRITKLDIYRVESQ